MLREFQILESVGKTTSRTAKLKLLSECNTDTMKSILKLAYDWRINLYVRIGKSKTRPNTNKGESDEALFQVFKVVCSKLESRAVTGNKARDLIETFLSKTGAASAWYERIINRDLKIGVNESTIVKVFPGLLQPFDVQLANVYERGASVAFPLALEPKYDGLRCVVIVRGNDARCFSRQGHEFASLQDFAELFLPIGDGVYDGEVMGEDWNCSVSLARSQKPGDRERAWEGLKYYVFDFVPLSDFDKKVCKLTASVRRQQLISRLDQLGEQNHVELVPQFVCENVEDIENYFQYLIDQGYEGVMIKDYDAPYRCKRSNAWLKYKPFRDEIFEIVGVTAGEGRHDGLPRMGALVVKFNETETFNIGSGYTDEVREELWSKREELIGRYVEAKVAVRPGQTSGTPTLVSFRRIRWDVD